MSDKAKVTVPAFRLSKGSRRLSMVTAYDTPSALACDGAGIDAILVGDSLGMVILGHPSTLPVTMEDMVHHLRAVRSGVHRALLIADMPYLSYHVSLEDSIRNAGRMVQEGGAEAVKIEGGKKRIPVIRALQDAEIPVMGHLGLTPQSVHALGGYRVQGREPGSAAHFVEAAVALQDAGVFAIVLEGMPDSVAAEITRNVNIPTIGIGAGPHCDGQVLVFHDLLGWAYGPLPKFVRPYADLKTILHEALVSYRRDVEEGVFPSGDESYGG
ncbi:MAG TPA: 3-methyl-2-oxobutanoate hydroxymethyltransferase [Thermoanaerobaculia bacterium]|nr:3-methyl-2-oxobutanoate hydroxymethyltransferase [Thermoanaerobaculia bacterium]HUM29408.1 3-methyl-2-oxobutanoate hydroxymethyltransferase [Thermoanaerobaculia bacterium]HXK67654.1 3-methyl-2-oxobutanoate hydroxymethyltransferase [Thermoanaerobaculia bacterium]